MVSDTTYSGWPRASTIRTWPALARLSAGERAAQLDIRQRLWRYTDQMWDQAKAQAGNPSRDPRYSAIAAMRDLLAELRAHAVDAIHAAGDRG